MIWCIAATESQKEHKVFDAIYRQGFEAFMPRDIIKRHVRGRHGKGAVLISRPMMAPRLVFAHIPAAAIPDLAEARYVTRMVSGMDGEVYVIPDAQMTAFMACHTDYLMARERLYAIGKPARSKRFSKTLKATAEGFAEVHRHLFGFNPATGELEA
jgi:hypothetical protein